MRFRSHEIGDIRRGEMTLLHLPYERRPLRFKIGHHYALERVDDVRVELESGEARYIPQARTLAGEFIAIEAIARQLTGDVTDSDALLAGFESAAEWLDAFSCDHGDFEQVWRVEFAYSLDAPTFMAIQGGQEHPEQYVRSQVRAIDDAEAPSGTDYQAWSQEAQAHMQRAREIRRLEERRRALDKRIEQLRSRAA